MPPLHPHTGAPADTHNLAFPADHVDLREDLQHLGFLHWQLLQLLLWGGGHMAETGSALS